MSQTLYLISLPNASMPNVLGPLEQRFKMHKLGQIHQFDSPLLTVGVTLDELIQLSDDLVVLNSVAEVSTDRLATAINSPCECRNPSIQLSEMHSH